MDSAMSLADFFHEVPVIFHRFGLSLAPKEIPFAGELVVRGDVAGYLERVDALVRDFGLAELADVVFFRSVIGSLMQDGGMDLSEKLGEACALGIDNKQVRAVLSHINEFYVLGAGVEITSHGLVRSFRFWSRMEKVEYLKNAAAVLELLRDRYGNACLAYGATLSCVRSDDLSPHDDDLDVLVGLNMERYPTFGAGVADVGDFLVAHGYEVIGRWPAFLKVGKPDMSADIDVFIGLNEGGMLAAIPGPRSAIAWESVFPSSERALFGVALALPAQPEIYLGHVYGPSWRTPQAGWQHQWNYSQYADIT